ncbi:MAG: tRNA dihydrouridine synthase DusB [Desulfuromonas sp.]|nr:MAG: tRNA dihydrouridine synthase DusB [Desulfuromonas sp.]
MQNETITNPTIGTLRLATPIILAPMAGISNLPYRRIMKSFGAGLVMTEMVSANGLIREGRKTRVLLDTHTEEFPLGIQLFGDDPQVLAQAAEMITEDGQLLDINMGCPVKKVIRSGAGSALLREPARIAAILAAVRKVWPGPLTIKIRSGWDDQSVNFLTIGEIAEREGVDAITLHPRTRSQGFSGHADWERIGELKSTLKIPVFGSGDIFTPEDAITMFEKTGCDAVMIGRGGYGNPWLIARILDQLSGRPDSLPTPEEIHAVAQRHLELYLEQFGEKITLLEMRKHLCWYARGLVGASQFRATIQKVASTAQLSELMEAFFAQNDH